MKKISIVFSIFLFIVGCGPAQYNNYVSNSYLTYNNLGLKNMEKGKYDVAIKDFNLAISLNPNDANLYNNRGWTYYYKGMYDLAMKDFNEALKINPNISDAYNGRGLIYYLRGQYDLAIKELNIAISLNPNDVYLIFNRGWAFCKKGMYDLAMKDFNEVLKKNPKISGAYEGRGIIYKSKGQYDLAIREYNMAISLNPTNYNLYNNRAILYWYMGKPNLAIEDYNKSIKLNPQDGTIYSNRGLAYAFLKKWEDAKNDLLTSKRLYPENAFCLYHLAFLRYKLKNLKEARDTLLYAINIDNNLMDVRGQFLKKSMDSKILRFYAEEYLFASQYLKAPEEYVKIAIRILNIGNNKQVAEVRFTDLKKEQNKSSLCVEHYPNRYLLAILVSEYDELPDLPYVKNDKKLIVELGGCFWGIPKSNISILENPTLASTKRKLREFLWSIHKKDAQIFLYYSGHGILNSRGEFFLLPKDAYIDTEEDLEETAISLKDVKKKLETVAGLKLAMIDACRVNPKWKAAMVINVDRAPRDVSIMFSTSLNDISSTEKKGNYSAFLSALHKIASSGVENLDFDNSGYVEVNELLNPLTVRIKKITTVKQKPQVIGNKNFPLFPLK